MKNLFEEAAGALLYAWNRQIDLPLPEKLRSRADGRSDLACAAFPLLGWLLGVCTVIPAYAAAVIFNVYAGAIIFALAVWAVFTWRDSGRSDQTVASVLTDALPGNGDQWRIAVPTVLMLGRIFLAALLFVSGNAWHITLVFSGVFALETLLVLDGGFRPPLLHDTPEARRNMYVTMGVLGLISFAATPLPAAVGAVAFTIIWRITQNQSERDGGTDLKKTSFAGGIAGWILLLAGILGI